MVNIIWFLVKFDIVRVSQEAVSPLAGVGPGLALQLAHVPHHLGLHDVKARQGVLLRVVSVTI